MNKYIRAVLLVVLPLLLVNCMGLSQNQRHAKISDATIFVNGSSDWVTDGAIDAAIAKDWSVILQDKAMLTLIDEALSNNPSLRASAERVARSKAILKQSRSSFFPRLDANASGNARTPLENSNFVDSYFGGLNASWEVDIWGRIRAGVAASEFDLASSKAFYRNAREALIAQTARTYVALIEAKKQRALNEETLSALQGTLRIVDIRHKLGSASRRETVLALSDVASANDSLEVADANVRTIARALEVLLGRYPTANITVPDIFPNINPAIAAGRPADILRRRPDVRLAENAVRSAFAGVDLQVRTNWPRLTLSSDLSGGGASFGDLFNPASLAFSVGLRLADNLFDGGLTKGRIEVAKSDGRQALAAYGQTVLDAFAEVESQLDAAMVLDRRRRFVEQSSKAAKETLRLAEIQYKEGDVDLLDVLTFRQRSFQADRTLLVIERQQYEARIALYLALGGADVVEIS